MDQEPFGVLLGFVGFEGENPLPFTVGVSVAGVHGAAGWAKVEAEVFEFFVVEDAGFVEEVAAFLDAFEVQLVGGRGWGRGRVEGGVRVADPFVRAVVEEDFGVDGGEGFALGGFGDDDLRGKERRCYILGMKSIFQNLFYKCTKRIICKFIL